MARSRPGRVGGAEPAGQSDLRRGRLTEWRPDGGEPRRRRPRMTEASMTRPRSPARRSNDRSVQMGGSHSAIVGCVPIRVDCTTCRRQPVAATISGGIDRGGRIRCLQGRSHRRGIRRRRSCTQFHQPGGSNSPSVRSPNG